MKVFSYVSDLYGAGPSCAVLGTFDGMHRAHRALLSRCLEISKAEGLTPIVFTFTDIPANAVAGRLAAKSVCTVERKIEIAESMGFEYAVCVPFGRSFMEMSAEDFARGVIADGLGARHAVCGYDYRFGYRAEGDAAMLAEFGKRYGFGVTVIPRMEIDGVAVSSSRLRELIAAGDLAGFERFAGYPYSLGGYVERGRGLGHGLGFPTANIPLPEELQLPPYGVYASRVRIEGEEGVFGGVSNIGVKPSVGNFSAGLEVNIFGYSKELYGKKISVELVSMIRPEKKFGSLDELKAQIAADAAEVSGILAEKREEF